MLVRCLVCFNLLILICWSVIFWLPKYWLWYTLTWWPATIWNAIKVWIHMVLCHRSWPNSCAWGVKVAPHKLTVNGTKSTLCLRLVCTVQCRAEEREGIVLWCAIMQGMVADSADTRGQSWCLYAGGAGALCLPWIWTLWSVTLFFVWFASGPVQNQTGQTKQD